MIQLNFEQIVNVSQIISTLAVAITAYLIFLQFRNQTKPQLRIEVKEGSKENNVQNILEYNLNDKRGLYLFVSNDSKETAEKIKISYSFNLKNENQNVEGTYDIPYLHPREQNQIPLPLQNILENCSELFETKEISKGSTAKIPKKTLYIEFEVKIQYSPLLFGFLEHKTRDEFFIEWGSLENYPELKKHPQIRSWNKRKDFYIAKKSMSGFT